MATLNNVFRVEGRKRLPKKDFPFRTQPTSQEEQVLKAESVKIRELGRETRRPFDGKVEYYLRHENLFVATQAVKELLPKVLADKEARKIALEEMYKRLKSDKNTLWSQHADAVAEMYKYDAFSRKSAVKRFLHPVGAWVRDKATVEETKKLLRTFKSRDFRKIVVANATAFDRELIKLACTDIPSLAALGENPSLPDDLARWMLDETIEYFESGGRQRPEYWSRNQSFGKSDVARIWRLLGRQGHFISKKQIDTVLRDWSKSSNRDENFLRRVLSVALSENPNLSAGHIEELMQTDSLYGSIPPRLVGHPNIRLETLIDTWAEKENHTVREVVIKNAGSEFLNWVRNEMLMERRLGVQTEYISRLEGENFKSYLMDLLQQAPAFAANMIARVEIKEALEIEEETMQRLLSNSDRNIRISTLDLLGKGLLRTTGGATQEQKPTRTKANTRQL